MKEEIVLKDGSIATEVVKKSDGKIIECILVKDGIRTKSVFVAKDFERRLKQPSQ